MFIKYLSLSTFIISLAIGLFVVYVWGPEMREIYVFPTPETVGRVQYKDATDTCFTFKSTEVECPKDDNKISYIPVQT